MYKTALVTAALIFLGTQSCSAQKPVPKSEPHLATECAHTETSFNCVKYLKNYDADTITFHIPNVHPLIGDKISVRVKHIDSPEIKGKLPCEKDVARTSKRLIENMLKNGKRIDLVNIERDKYFRVLADVKIDGKDVAETLIKNNLAYAYEGKTKEKVNWCKRAVASEK